MPEPRGPGRPLAPQYLANQSTLFQPGRADYPHLSIATGTPNVFHLPASLTYLVIKAEQCRKTRQPLRKVQKKSTSQLVLQYTIKQ